MEEFKEDKKTTKIDERGRITIPADYRKFFPNSAEVAWRFDGKCLIVDFEGVDRVQYLTSEFLQNQILDLRKEIVKMGESISELRKLAFRKLMDGPE